jgi:hypothetical protein
MENPYLGKKFLWKGVFCVHHVLKPGYEVAGLPLAERQRSYHLP